MPVTSTDSLDNVHVMTQNELWQDDNKTTLFVSRSQHTWSDIHQLLQSGSMLDAILQ